MALALLPATCTCLQNKTYPFLSSRPPDLTRVTRRELREYFINAFDLNELLFSSLKDEKYFLKCPDRLRLPLIFYLAHTATLYINKLVLAGLLEKRVNHHFEMVFEMGVDEMSWDDTENHRLGGTFVWPSVSEVMEYRNEVRRVVLNIIDNAKLELPINLDHPWWSLVMGIEHERIHVETSSVLLNQLPVSMLRRPVTWKYAPLSMDVPPGTNEFLTVPAGSVVMGKPEGFPTFGWDNEYGEVNVQVPEFKASKYLITNREFLEFVEDGGYQHKELWTEEGWQWVTYREAKHPLMWVCSNGCKSGCGGDLASFSHCTPPANSEDNSTSTAPTSTNGWPVKESKTFRYRAIFEELPMPWDWPVLVNYHEVKAFCAWKGPNCRVPTEAEHHRMRGDPPLSCDYSCDPSLNVDCPANMHLKYGSPSPVNMFAPTSTGHYDVYGNLWEWGEDHFNGFPGSHNDYLYDDFSTPFYDGRHTMIMGGSWISLGLECSRFARFGFRRHFYQHSGFRLVYSTNITPVRLCQAEIFIPGNGLIENSVDIPNLSKECWHQALNPQFQYESEDSLLSELHRTYGNVKGYITSLEKFMKTLLQQNDVRKSSALVLGCGAGCSTFILTKYFSKVLGIDFSGRFVDAALNIQSGKEMSGVSMELSLATVLDGIQTQRAFFKQLTSVVNEIRGHDLVLVEFLDRLTESKGWQRKLWETVDQHQALLVVIETAKWEKNRIEGYIGKWFVNINSSIIAGDRIVTVWRYISRENV